MQNKFYMLIDGKWIKAESGKNFQVINPATSEIIAEVPSGEKKDACKALEAAGKAFEEWRSIPPPQRAKFMHKAADLIRKHQNEISKLLTQEQGKPLLEAKGEVSGAAEAIDYYAEEAYRILGEVIPTNSPKRRSLVIKQPIGVVGAIAPWNYPVGLLIWKVAPALIAGCTIVAKPSSYTPLSAIKTFECFEEAGIPAGVLNLVTGSGSIVGDELIRNPITRKIAFTGETSTGKEIMSKAGINLKRLSLELGGSCPLIVCEDADLESAVKGGIYRSFRNMGQVCNSINRIYVDKTIASRFIERFVEETKKLKIGNGLEEPEVDLGPMTTNEQREHTKRHIKDAVNKGAKILCGGKEPENEKFKRGFFFEPTVLSEVNHSMIIMQEETFGPVAPIMVVNNMDEAIKLANDTRYGLVSYVYTKDIKRAITIAESFECGTVSINNVSGGEVPYPYGGWKESGLGLELSHHGLEEYLQLKHIRLDIGY